jgi:hypothetical protein
MGAKAPQSEQHAKQIAERKRLGIELVKPEPPPRRPMAKKKGRN